MCYCEEKAGMQDGQYGHCDCASLISIENKQVTVIYGHSINIIPSVAQVSENIRHIRKHFRVIVTT